MEDLHYNSATWNIKQERNNFVHEGFNGLYGIFDYVWKN